MLRRMPLRSIIRCVGWLMFPTRSGVSASAFDVKAFAAGGSTSGNSAAVSNCRLCITASGISGRGGQRCGGRVILLLAHERLERLGPGAADLVDRVRHREAYGFRGEAGRAERFPERGEMFDRVRVPATREGLVAPLVVGDFLIMDVLAENAREARDDLLQGNGGADHRIGRSRRQRGAGQQANGNVCDVLTGYQRKNGGFLAPGQPNGA